LRLNIPVKVRDRPTKGAQMPAPESNLNVLSATAIVLVVSGSPPKARAPIAPDTVKLPQNGESNLKPLAGTVNTNRTPTGDGSRTVEIENAEFCEMVKDALLYRQPLNVRPAAARDPVPSAFMTI